MVVAQVRTIQYVSSDDFKASILLVDDHPANLLALEGVLEPLGQRLVRAISGEEALKRVLAEDFALILMDVQMPGLDGFQTASLLRHRERTRDVPIIFLTALHKGLEHARRGYALGAFDYITKPFEPEIVTAKVSAFVALHLRALKLSRQSEELARRERAIGQEIAARQAAEESIRVNELFMGILGHDLQNPLTAISMAARLLGSSGELSEKHVEITGRITRSAHRMERIIADVLDFTRGRLGGGIPVAPVAADLGVICRQILEEQQLANPDRSLRFESAGDLSGRWDPDRLGQLVSNLSGNAIRHGADPITLVASGEPSEVLLEVRNRGEAISPEVIGSLFDPFRKGDQRSSGLGLGLYIVQEIARAHQATVTVRSTPQEGTCFMVRLPRVTAGTSPAA